MKYKRILALAAAVVLLLLYASAIIFALMDNPMAERLFLASLFCSVVLPAILYGYTVFIKYTKRQK